MTTTATKPLAPRHLDALRALAAHKPIAVKHLGILQRAGYAKGDAITDAGRALLASLDSAAHVNAIAARLSDLGYEGVRAVSTKTITTLDAIEVRGQVYPLRAVMVDGNVAEAALRIVADLSGEDAVALASRGALPVFEVSFAATDDVDEDDFGRPTASRFSREWPAVSAERARAEATAWGESDGCAVVTDVEGGLL